MHVIDLPLNDAPDYTDPDILELQQRLDAELGVADQFEPVEDTAERQRAARGRPGFIKPLLAVRRRKKAPSDYVPTGPRGRFFLSRRS